MTKIDFHWREISHYEDELDAPAKMIAQACRDLREYNEHIGKDIHEPSAFMSRSAILYLTGYVEFCTANIAQNAIELEDLYKEKERLLDILAVEEPKIK